jgi:hypothetical protein
LLVVEQGLAGGDAGEAHRPGVEDQIPVQVTDAGGGRPMDALTHLLLDDRRRTAEPATVELATPLPPRRLAPCTPPVSSPAANRPGMSVLQSGLNTTPPIM